MFNNKKFLALTDNLSWQIFKNKQVKLKCWKPKKYLLPYLVKASQQEVKNESVKGQKL